jgi:hypothetical protein
MISKNNCNAKTQKAIVTTSLLSSTFSNCFSHKTNVKTPTLPPHHLLQIARMKKMERNFTQA